MIPGLGPDGNAYTITTLEDAIHAGEGWRRFLDQPGDIVIGATQGAGCFGAAYEYLFNVSHQLRKAGLKKQVNLTYVTAEPFLGHFGIGGLPHGEQLLGMFLNKEHIAAVVNTAMDHVEEGRLVFADGTGIEFAYAMIVPPFVGQDVIRRASDIADEKGYVNVRDTYQTEAYDDVYAVGIAAAVNAPWQTATPVGIPKTGYPPNRWPTSPPRISPRRSAANSPRRTRTSVTFRPFASWTPATTGSHPRRQDASTAQARRVDPRAPVARHEGRLREVLHLEGQARLRLTSLTASIRLVDQRYPGTTVAAVAETGGRRS